MAGLYLTRNELTELTGYKLRTAVVRWLDRNGWPYATAGIDGWPRVLRQYHDERLFGQPMKTKRQVEPNWSTA